MSEAAAASLRALLHALIDYAGIFPPAGHSVDRAARDFAAYGAGPGAWMLARFVFPARRLAELGAYADALFTAQRPFRIAALGTGGDDAASALEALGGDLRAIAAFRAVHGARVVVDAIETRLPESLANGGDAVALGDYLRAAGVAVQSAIPGPVAVFHETPLGGDWKVALPRVAAALATAGAGLKLRTGGLEAAAFPSTHQVAAAIDACRRAGAPFKATAGLHHPVRHFNAQVGASMHGFLNVFGGAALAAAGGLDRPALVEILEESDPSAFRFEDGALRWRHREASVAAVAESRRTLAISYGSCSFEEPREDLAALALLSR